MGFGSYYIYKCNGCEDGPRLLERYISLGWVVFVRFLPLVVLPAMVLLGVVDVFFLNIPEESGVPQTILTIFLGVAFYLILGRHLREIRGSAT